MYRINGKITIILWVVAILTAIYMLFFWFDFYSILATGFTIGVATAQTIDAIREKKYLSKFRNYVERRRL